MRAATTEDDDCGHAACAGFVWCQQADPQLKAIYAWEDSWRQWDRNTHTLPELRAAIRQACAHYGVEAPAVVQHNARALSYSQPCKNIISLQAVGPLNKGGKNMAVAMHEAAHHIVFKLCGWRPKDHGPTFLGVYLWLLEKSGVAPLAALHASARVFNLKWRNAPPGFQCKS